MDGLDLNILSLQLSRKHSYLNTSTSAAAKTMVVSVCPTISTMETIVRRYMFVKTTQAFPFTPYTQPTPGLKIITLRDAQYYF